MLCSTEFRLSCGVDLQQFNLKEIDLRIKTVLC